MNEIWKIKKGFGNLQIISKSIIRSKIGNGFVFENLKTCQITPFDGSSNKLSQKNIEQKKKKIKVTKMLSANFRCAVEVWRME